MERRHRGRRGSNERGAGVVVLCTTCSKRKRRRPATPIPAARRYLSRRISRVLAEARRRALPAVILSGRYGLLSPRERIPWYDRALLPSDVPAMTRKLERQIRRLHAGTLELWARPPSTPGWRPYHDALRVACAAVGVRLVRVDLDASWR